MKQLVIAETSSWEAAWAIIIIIIIIIIVVVAIYLLQLGLHPVAVVLP
jgi:hypothetical protein